MHNFDSKANFNNKWLRCCEIHLRWLSPVLTDDKWALGWGRGWCCLEKGHYLNRCRLNVTLWDRKRTQWATWGRIRTKKDSFWVGRLKWFHCWFQMVSFWVAVRKLLPLGAKLVSFWMVWNHRVSNRLTWSQLVLFWVAYRKAPPQRAKMASFWVVWFPCG